MDGLDSKNSDLDGVKVLMSNSNSEVEVFGKLPLKILLEVQLVKSNYRISKFVNNIPQTIIWGSKTQIWGPSN